MVIAVVAKESPQPPKTRMDAQFRQLWGSLMSRGGSQRRPTAVENEHKCSILVVVEEG